VGLDDVLQDEPALREEDHFVARLGLRAVLPMSARTAKQLISRSHTGNLEKLDEPITQRTETRCFIIGSSCANSSMSPQVKPQSLSSSTKQTK